MCRKRFWDKIVKCDSRSFKRKNNSWQICPYNNVDEAQQYVKGEICCLIRRQICSHISCWLLNTSIFFIRPSLSRLLCENSQGWLQKNRTIKSCALEERWDMDNILVPIIVIIYSAWAIYSEFKVLTERSPWLDTKAPVNMIVKILLS